MRVTIIRAIICIRDVNVVRKNDVIAWCSPGYIVAQRFLTRRARLLRETWTFLKITIDGTLNIYCYLNKSDDILLCLHKFIIYLYIKSVLKNLHNIILYVMMRCVNFYTTARYIEVYDVNPIINFYWCNLNIIV